jgi:hypothetical protein
MKLFKMSYSEAIQEPADVIFDFLEIQNYISERQEKDLKKANKKHGRR